MKVEVLLNEVEGDWWFGLGICYEPSNIYTRYTNLISINIVFFTIYIRFNKIKKK
jgi:hypothetical protein